jgi:Tol biopolymer transport system component
VSAAGAAGNAPRNGLIAFSRLDDGSNEDVYVVSADGSGERRLTDQFGHDSGPAWSPDGRKIAFFSRRHNNTDIYVMNADGTGVRRLTRSSNYDWSPDWSPDGQRIVFMSFGRAPEGKRAPQRLFVVNADGSGRRLLTPTVRDAATPPGRSTVAGSRSGRLRHLRDQRRRHRPATTDQELAGTWLGSEPAWSRDGRSIAFTSSGDITPLGIYVMRADGTGQRRLSSNRANDSSPSWSPDGTQIVFVCGGNQISDICVVGADGHGRKRLTEDSAQARLPDWQPRPG